MDQIKAYKTSDFKPTGDGKSSNWNKAKWVTITQRSHMDTPLQTKVKVLYSETGIYFLFHCEDPKLNASITEDGAHLWLEDVVEVFIWPDTTKEIYFEYELSPLNQELPLMVMNFGGKPHRWQAWYHEDDRNIVHGTSVQGGEKESSANIESWMGEFFIPYALLSPMIQAPPNSGTQWRTNFNRMDYLDEKEIYWSWQDLPGSFHEITRFGTLLFE
ncbi:carbohydrate-binding family 9-like protein [Flagellimonas iocasae]|uniref:Carbohydrate-binding family 9-like protein n=1 Tax=Flagellimonas iocasae TaxID=2055905 RepID=A0ABW4Y2M6_9FLAO